MNKLLKSVSALGLAGALLVPSLTANAASPSDNTKSLKTGHQTHSINQKEKMHTYVYKIDGVRVAIHSQKRIPKEVLQETLKMEKKQIENIKKDTQKKNANSLAISPYSITPPPGGGGAYTKLATKYNAFFAGATRSGVKTTIAGSAGAIAANLALKFAKLASKSTAIGIISSGVASYVVSTIPPWYTTTNWLRWYSSYYGHYVYRYSSYVYSDSARTNLTDVELSGLFQHDQNGVLIVQP